METESAADKQCGLNQRDVGTWAAFETELTALRNNTTGSLLFRGHEDSNWPLTTTLERNHRRGMPLHEYYAVILKVRPQIEAFTDNRWVIEKYLAVKKLTSAYDAFSVRLTSGRLPGYAYMAHLRHHGFPSPLLDWTRSSHVAAYFAFNKASEDTGSKQVSVYVFEEPSVWNRSNRAPNIFRLGPYVRTHRRHFLQQSEYTLCVRFDDESRFDTHEKAFDSGSQGRLWKFNIPSTERLKVLKALDEYNLNAFSLLNSEESLMETMALREFHFNSRQA